MVNFSFEKAKGYCVCCFAIIGITWINNLVIPNHMWHKNVKKISITDLCHVSQQYSSSIPWAIPNFLWKKASSSQHRMHGSGGWDFAFISPEMKWQETMRKLIHLRHLILLNSESIEAEWENKNILGYPTTIVQNVYHHTNELSSHFHVKSSSKDTKWGMMPRLDLLQDQESTSMDHGKRNWICAWHLHMLLQQLLPQTDMEVT